MAFHNSMIHLHLHTIHHFHIFLDNLQVIRRVGGLEAYHRYMVSGL